MCFNTGTTEHTINDMWRMIWQEEARLIVMTTNLKEGKKVWDFKGLLYGCDWRKNLVDSSLAKKHTSEHCE